MKNILVFCGSSFGHDQAFSNIAKQLGEALVKNNYRLIYGGASVGLMGIIAQAVLEQGGEVTGIIPEIFSHMNIAQEGMTETIVTSDLTDRKKLMEDMSDACIAIPGGFGTLDELTQAITHSQIGHYKKPVGALNINGFFDGLISQFDRCVKDGFLRQEYRERLLVDSNIDGLISLIQEFKWMDSQKVYVKS